MVRFELANAKTIAGTTSISTRGYVVEGGYHVLSDLQPVIRYENLKPDTSVAFSNSAVSLGVNYFLAKNSAKFQLGYFLLTNMDGRNGSYQQAAAGTTAKTGRLLILSYQTAI